MPTQQASLQCGHCQRATLHARPSPSHLVHALATFFLCGLWAPVWLFASLSSKPFRCQTCGHAQPQPAVSRGAIAAVVIVGIVAVSAVVALALSGVKLNQP